MKKFQIYLFLFLIVFASASTTVLAQAPAPVRQIKILPTRFDGHIYGSQMPANAPTIVAVVGRYFNPQQYREVRAQLLRNAQGQADHILVYLFRPGYHQVRNAVIAVDQALNVRGVQMDYNLNKFDVEQQPGHDALQVKCPDPSVQFIAFAPNDNDLEQQITVQVGKFAMSKGLKTMMLLKAQATRQNYLDYMSCPNLLGNFYDGDANPHEIVTVDGVISAAEFTNLLKGAFRHKVTNIWLACQAYNDPMLTAVEKISESQKYYAGINNLEVGPSDKAAACTMQGALSGNSISSSFDSCYKQYDVPADHWGFGGDGSDFFGR